MIRKPETDVFNKEWASQMRREILGPGSSIRNDPNL